ncbi:MAG: hypothetical protein IJC52_00750, partial [Clostridia bacterium]|nr:hypothetical protein [Clostridia bacterium]
MWKSTYVDAINNIDGAAVRRTATYCNGQAVNGVPAKLEKNDVKAIFYTDDKARIANLPDGYVFTLPATDFTPDYSLSEQRSRYVSDRFILNVSYEDKNPYADRKEPWKIYLTEWLERYIANDHFLEDNNISRLRPVTESADILPGYVVRSYDMVINDAGDIAMPYYHIAVIREADNELTFYLMTMKATTDSSAMMDEMVRSFKEITKLGKAQNHQTVYECKVPDCWNDETKAYYEKLCKQDKTDWGFFSFSMPDIDDSCYDYQDGRISKEYARLSGLLDYEYEIMPTYTHLLYGRRENAFPIDMALNYANGNGFDGKPVLQYTYQFTASNNVDLADYTPTFDIMRGVYDEQLRKLARDIKSYRK